MGHQIQHLGPDGTYKALRFHPNFKMPKKPKLLTPENAAVWALEVASAFVSPPKIAGENEDFACEDVAKAIKKRLIPEILKIFSDDAPPAESKEQE